MGVPARRGILCSAIPFIEVTRQARKAQYYERRFSDEIYLSLTMMRPCSSVTPVIASIVADFASGASRLSR